MENSAESWFWNSADSSSVSLHDSNDLAMRMCQGCQHCGGMYYCMVNCAEYQNMIGKAYQKP